MRGRVNIIQFESLRGDVNKGIYEHYVSKNISVYCLNIRNKGRVRRVFDRQHSAKYLSRGKHNHHLCSLDGWQDTTVQMNNATLTVFYRLGKHVCTRNTHPTRRRSAHTHTFLNASGFPSMLTTASCLAGVVTFPFIRGHSCFWYFHLLARGYLSAGVWWLESLFQMLTIAGATTWGAR